MRTIEVSDSIVSPQLKDRHTNYRLDRQHHNPYVADQEYDSHITPENQYRDARIEATIMVGPKNPSWPTLEDCCKNECDTDQRNCHNTDDDQNSKMLEDTTV